MCILLSEPNKRYFNLPATTQGFLLSTSINFKPHTTTTFSIFGIKQQVCNMYVTLAATQKNAIAEEHG